MRIISPNARKSCMPLRDDNDYEFGHAEYEYGLTKLEYFSIKCLQAMLSNPDFTATTRELEKKAVNHALDLLQELETLFNKYDDDY